MSRLEKCKAAIKELFGDTSVDPEVTQGMLEELQEFIDELMNTLKY